MFVTRLFAVNDPSLELSGLNEGFRVRSLFDAPISGSASAIRVIVTANSW